MRNSGGVRFVDLPGFKFSLVAETASRLQFAKLPTFQATLMSKVDALQSSLFTQFEYEDETMTTDVDDLIQIFFLRAIEDLKAGDVLLRVPLSLHISPSFVRALAVARKRWTCGA